RRRDRPPHRALRLCGRAGRRNLPHRVLAVQPPATRGRAVGRLGRCKLRRGESMAQTAREFFETLESRVDATKTAGMTNSYLFEIEGAGTWTVDVNDGA